MKRVLLLSTAVMLAVSGIARLASAQTAPKPAAGSDAQPVAVMLEQGIYQEETAGNLEAAAKTYRQIVEQAAVGRSLVAQALGRLAAIQVRQKQLDSARQTIERLKTEYPEQKDAIARVEALLPNQRPSVAIAGGDHGERPPIQSAHVPTAEERAKATELAKQGWKDYRDGKLKKAGQEFRAALDLDRTSIDAWNGLGWVELSENHEGSMPALTFGESLKLDPKNPVALNGTGWALWRGDSKDLADGYWRQAVDADSSATSAISGLAQNASQKGEFDDAVRWYKKWLDLEPKNAEANSGLANVQQMQTAALKATATADEFFKLLDTGKFDEARKLTFSVVKVRFLSETTVADFDGSRDKPAGEQSGWTDYLKEFRASLGATIDRRVESISCGREVHPESERSGPIYRKVEDFPRGPVTYVSFQFNSRFENRRNVTEYLALSKSESGEWKIITYTISQPPIPRDPLKGP